MASRATLERNIVQGEKEYKRVATNEVVLFLVNFFKNRNIKIGAMAPEIMEINLTLRGFKPRIKMGKIDK